MDDSLTGFSQYLRWQNPEVPVVVVATDEQLEAVPAAVATILPAPYAFTEVVEAFQSARRLKPVFKVV